MRITIPMSEQNELTKRMLAQGYKLDDPDNPKWPENVWRGDPNNFEYKAEWKYTPTWESPCGLLIHEFGGFWGETFVMGVYHCRENDNPLFQCPYPGKLCEHRLKGLPPGINCQFHPTEREWTYEGSHEQAIKQREEAIAKAREELRSTTRQNCFCEESKDMPDGSIKYYYKYNLDNCINYACNNEICAARNGAKRDTKKVNIFYDLKITRRYSKGFLTSEEKSVIKGIKVFDKAIAKTDAEIALKMWRSGYKRMPIPMSRLHPADKLDSQEVFFTRHYGRFGEKENCEIESEIVNIRIARFDQKDILQDLSDVQAGIEVTHESDKIKAKSENKKKRIRERKIASVIKWIKALQSNEGGEEEEGNRERIRIKLAKMDKKILNEAKDRISKRESMQALRAAKKPARVNEGQISMFEQI